MTSEEDARSRSLERKITQLRKDVEELKKAAEVEAAELLAEAEASKEWAKRINGDTTYKTC
jgi:hypothetical protein